jgi:hypothetical protein
MKKIIKIEIIRVEDKHKANDLYFVPEGIHLTEDDVKKFKIANTAWQVIAHCDPPADTFEVTL